MRPSKPILVALALAALAIPPAVSGQRWRTAEADAQAANTSLLAVRSDAEQIKALRALEERVAEEKRPEQDVIARVNTTLQASGLSPDRLVSVRLESDAPLPGSQSSTAYRRQAMRVSLKELTLPQLGAFLVSWRQEQQLWTPIQIELSHARAGQTETGMYNVALVIAATYIAQPP